MIDSAMLQQVDRVNDATHVARYLTLDDTVKLVQENRHLQQLLQQKDDEITKLKAMLVGSTEHRGNWEVITPSEAARRLGVSKSTICRRLQAGKIQGDYVPNSNRQRIYADSSRND